MQTSAGGKILHSKKEENFWKYLFFKPHVLLRREEFSFASMGGPPDMFLTKTRNISWFCSATVKKILKTRMNIATFRKSERDFRHGLRTRLLEPYLPEQTLRMTLDATISLEESRHETYTSYSQNSLPSQDKCVQLVSFSIHWGKSSFVDGGTLVWNTHPHPLTHFALRIPDQASLINTMQKLTFLHASPTKSEFSPQIRRNLVNLPNDSSKSTSVDFLSWYARAGEGEGD